MDLSAILARRPALALVDDLAHANVFGAVSAGPSHEKRWQDVEVLLAAGIEVVTTVSIENLESLADVGYKELKKAGAFLLPGFAKFVVIKKPATKARKGINPFTKEPTIFKAKPARKIIKARPVKAAKDAV